MRTALSSLASLAIGFASPVVSVGTWVFPNRAHAASRGEITLDLRTDADAPPTHLCVATENRGPRNRAPLSSLLGSSVSIAGARSFELLSTAWNNDDADATAPACSTSHEADCRPRVDLPETFRGGEQLYVACTADALAGASSPGFRPRVLVLFLEHLGGSPPALDSLRLAGGIAVVGVEANLASVTVTARSLGGHYVPHTRSHREDSGTGAGKLVNLVVTPRCRAIDFVLPRPGLLPRDRSRLRVRLNGTPIDVAACVEPSERDDVLTALVPGAVNGVGLVEVELRPRDNELAGAAVYGQTWLGPWPRSPLLLDTHQVSFIWKRPECTYPADRCPTATLETGTSCQATVIPAGCEYRCPGTRDGADPAALVLPLTVTFEKDRPQQRWTDTLAKSGQILTSYVPADEIRLEANISAWPTALPGNRIRHVEIYGESGERIKLPVTHSVVPVRVPGASCNPIAYRPVGEREYVEGVAAVRNAKIELGPPWPHARVVNFGFMLAFGGGPAWLLDPASSGGGSGRQTSVPVYFSGLGQLAIRFRPRRPTLARLFAEGRIVSTFGQWGVGDEPKVVGQQNFGWARVLLEPALGIDAFPRVAFSVGLGLGTSFPIRRVAELENKNFWFLVSPVVDARVRVRDWISIVLQLRSFFNEAGFRAREENVVQAPMVDPRTQQVRAASLLVLTGLSFQF